jgi:hypothetical protein
MVGVEWAGEQQSRPVGHCVRAERR